MKTGDYGLTRIQVQPLGMLIELGLFLCGDASRWSHAFVVIDGESGLAIEARPGGAGYTYAKNWEPCAYSHLDLTDEQRAAIVKAAEEMIGRGYNWLDYPALALVRFGIRPKFLTKFVADKGRLICSQLVDEVYRKAGIHLFNDGRPSQDVTPGDLTYVGQVW